MARRSQGRRKEPRVDEPDFRPDRLDMGLTPDDRPLPVRARPKAHGQVRPRGNDAGGGRYEPIVHDPVSDIELDTSEVRGRRRRPAQARIDDGEEMPRPARASRDNGAPPRRKAPPSRKRRGGRPPTGIVARTIRRLVYWALVAGIWGGIVVAGIVVYYGSHLPPASEWAVPKRPPNIRIVATDGALIGNRGDAGGEEVKLRDLPAYLPAAVVAIEDRRFYSHFGVDPIGLGRAVYVNVVKRGVSQGGSTLTQQLAKNLFLTQDRNLGRKVQEVLLALWLEREHTKQQILEMYLNRVYFGAGAYGVDAAARRYYGKPAEDVTLMEAAMLAGLLKAPSRYAPSRNPDLARERATTVLATMVETGAITAAERDAALKAPRTILEKPNVGSEAYVADWVMDILPGFIGSVNEDIVVETSVDSGLQMLAEGAITAGLDQFGIKQDIGEGALVSLDATGAVKAMVGGSDYRKTQYNRAVSARRQPGSAFKPFVYMAAMEAGLTPQTVRVDEPIKIKGWAPKNFTKEFKGPITLQDALAQSINTVAVRLALEVGPRKVASIAERLGITSPLQVNASIALGTSEVTPLEITGAYAAFANGGFGVTPHVIDRIATASGKTLYTWRGAGFGRVIDPVVLAEMNQMMAETLISGSGKKAQIAGWPSGAKSGTSQEGRDVWFIGFTGMLTTAVWLGNDDGSPTKHATGGATASTIWHKFMLDAHRGRPVVQIPGAQRPGDNGPVATGSISGVIQHANGPTPPTGLSPQPATPSRADRGGLEGFLKTLFGG